MPRGKIDAQNNDDGDDDDDFTKESFSPSLAWVAVKARGMTFKNQPALQVLQAKYRLMLMKNKLQSHALNFPKDSKLQQSFDTIFWKPT